MEGDIHTYRITIPEEKTNTLTRQILVKLVYFSPEIDSKDCGQPNWNLRTRIALNKDAEDYIKTVTGNDVIPLD